MCRPVRFQDFVNTVLPNGDERIEILTLYVHGTAQVVASGVRFKIRDIPSMKLPFYRR